MEAGEIPTTILRQLGTGLCLTMDALEAETTLTRRQISNGAGQLILRGYAERTEKGCYQITKSGQKALADGIVIKSGPRGADTAVVRKPVRGTFRQRVWTAMRLSNTFTVGDLVMFASDAEANPYQNASRYIRRLKSAGYVIELPRRAAGTAITSSGYKRFRLVSDSGPKAPVYRPKKQTVHDYNTGEELPCR